MSTDYKRRRRSKRHHDPRGVQPSTETVVEIVEPTNNSCSEEITDQIIEETYAAVTEGGSNNTIDSGADADESGLEVDYSNVYKLDDEDGDWEQWEEEDFMSNEDSNDEWLP